MGKLYTIESRGKLHAYTLQSDAKLAAEEIFHATGVIVGIGEIDDHKPLIGRRVEIPVHYDSWMRGARFGTVTVFRRGKLGQSDYLMVKLDHPQIRRRLKLWRIDWPYAKFEGSSI